MNMLAVRRTGGRIAISAGRTGDAAREHMLPSFVAMSGQANRIASRLSEAIGDRYWRLEYSKLIAGDGFAVIGQGQEIAEQAGSEETVQVFSGVIDPARVRFASAHELAAKGNGIVGMKSTGLLLRLRYLVSALTAFAVWLWSLLRFGWGNRLSACEGKACLIAVHGEISNRTRHVLAAAAQSDQVAAIIVLGRPVSSLAALRAQFSSELRLHETPVCRPIGIRAALRSLPRLFGLIVSGSSVASATGFMPRWQDEIAVLYRMCLGACSYEWWKEQAISPGIVVYGQTGLADTSMLEAAQQEAGAKTVHWVHGLSGGWNFTGLSDLGLFKCGLDADTHSKLPEYGKTGFFELPKPAYREGNGNRWLLLTNYAHPSNLYFGHGAVDLEIQTLRIATDAALRTGISSDQIVWRPHPVFWSLPIRTRNAILASVSDTGIALPEPDGAAPSYEEYRAVFCTPSTVAVEMLASGILPIIIAPHDIAPETVYTAFPLRAANASALEAALTSLADRPTVSALFETTWHRVRPGDADIGLADIVGRLASVVEQGRQG
jgi:hypothetical protein